MRRWLQWLTPKPLYRTRAEVADIIEQFLDGTCGEWDWDDFSSFSIADPELEAIRKRCVALYDYPTSGQYTGPEGVAEMRAMVARLRQSNRELVVGPVVD